MKLDAHHHFWHYNPSDYNWIGDDMQNLKRDYLPLELESILKETDFDGSIAVQARQSLEETRWLLQLASENSFIKGVVGWVDLCSPSIESQLQEFSKHPKLVGVRHVVHDEPDDNFMARQDFQHGISLLEKYHLTYDLLIFPKHLPLAAKLVSRFPRQLFVLDHIAKPHIKNQIKQPWTLDIEKLAQHPNVFCKLSGMATEASWNNWKPGDFEFYLETVFNAFGPDRIMIGSDWPVCTVAGTYSEVMSIVANFVKRFDSQTQNKILGINCERFYLK